MPGVDWITKHCHQHPQERHSSLPAPASQAQLGSALARSSHADMYSSALSISMTEEYPIVWITPHKGLDFTLSFEHLGGFPFSLYHQHILHMPPDLWLTHDTFPRCFLKMELLGLESLFIFPFLTFLSLSLFIFPRHSPWGCAHWSF